MYVYTYVSMCVCMYLFMHERAECLHTCIHVRVLCCLRRRELEPAGELATSVWPLDGPKPQGSSVMLYYVILYYYIYIYIYIFIYLIYYILIIGLGPRGLTHGVCPHMSSVELVGAIVALAANHQYEQSSI